jgi:hypothetical protein
MPIPIPESFVFAGAGEGGVNGVEGDGVGFVVDVVVFVVDFGFIGLRGGIGKIQIRSLNLLCWWSVLSSHLLVFPCV